MPKLTTFIFNFVILLVITLSCNQAFAFDVGISPPDVNLVLNRGEVYQGETNILGSNNEATEINAYANDWSLNTSGNYQFLPLGTLKRSASPWISFTPKKFNLPPQRGQKIAYTIKVPQDANGSYWAVLMFGTRPTLTPGKEQMQITMSARVAYVIRIDILGSPPGVGSIERFQLSWNANQKKIDAKIRIRNSGISFIRFKGRIELKDRQGKKVGVIPFNEGLVLPDHSREFFLADSDLKLAPGYYIGLAIADFGGRNLKAVQSSFQVEK